jgi:O-antigen ligase
VTGSRVGGTLGSPNAAGAYLVFLLAPAVALALSPVDRGLRRLAIVAIAIGVPTLVFTFSRGAWLGFIAALLVIFAGSRAWGRRLSTGVKAGLVIGLLVLLVPLQGVIAARLTSDDQGAASGRVPLIQLAELMIRAHPLTGVGANNFPVVLPDYAGARFATDWLVTVHNKYLLFWAEDGLLALLAFIALLVLVISWGWRARRAGDALIAAVGVGLAASVVAAAVHYNFDHFRVRPMSEPLWLAGGLLGAPVFAAWRRRAALGRAPR